ncbi:MAG TPA: hypothetical protein VEJ44_03810 [Acidimicrobiales bacterium]|nr:hypothetical protein [Acidimicrobiales bacterium]
MDLAIGQGDDGSYVVEVQTPTGASTRHHVTVPPGYPAEIGCEGVAGEELVRASFGFLLEREPATAILRRFRLDQIESYFPEYRREMRRWGASAGGG